MADEEKKQQKTSSLLCKLLGPLSLAGATAALLAGAAGSQHMLLKPTIELGKAQLQQLMSDSAKNMPQLLLIAQSAQDNPPRPTDPQKPVPKHASHTSHASHASHASHRSAAF